MKLLFASDLHGSLYYCNKLKEIYEKESPEKLIFLGDLLYHGPRNDLPRDYNPKKVIEILNSMSTELLCVRGNCDSEVDQMVLDFPILSDYALLYIKDRMIFLTHGHTYNLDNLPKLKNGDILIHGHTHIRAMEQTFGITYLNPGSLSLPKGGNTNSYMTYENDIFEIKDLDGKVISSISI